MVCQRKFVFSLRERNGRKHSHKINFVTQKGKKNQQKTRGQRQNKSQKAVILDMMKSVGEIASEI